MNAEPLQPRPWQRKEIVRCELVHALKAILAERGRQAKAYAAPEELPGFDNVVKTREPETPRERIEARGGSTRSAALRCFSPGSVVQLMEYPDGIARRYTMIVHEGEEDSE